MSESLAERHEAHQDVRKFLCERAAKFGTTTDAIVRAAQQSNARFTDLLAKNLGNVNTFLARPDGAAGFVRVTTDPSGTRVISAGLMRSGQVANGVINGRFVPLR